MITKERVEAVLDRVRPFLRADGGDIVLVAVQGNSADVRLTGLCAGCPSAQMTLHRVLPVALPPLRERREDIPVLMDAFISRYSGVAARIPQPFPRS